MKRLPLILLLGLLAGFPALSGADRVGRLLEEGARAYEEGRYPQAYATYQRVLAYGVRNPDLYYNLGNAAFRTRKLGEAVFYYERALWLNPGHADARFNLDYARHFLVDKVLPPADSWLEKTWQWFVTGVGTDGATVVMLLLFSVLLAAILLFLRGRDGPRRIILLAVLAGILVLNLVWGALFAGMVWREENVREGVILLPAVDTRSGPSEGNPVLFTIHEGLTVELGAQARGWRQVILPNGWNGWVPGKAIGVIQE